MVELAVYGKSSERAISQYLEIAVRIAARLTDEELGITPADYADPAPRRPETSPR